ncbi:ATP-dependent DNA ligase [Phenylobacterium sp.]|uniref:ATP-dependent DNA ligase n=1 Tax=Phenylobacterium sp. TaxID=1871053 RepID=UPI003BACFB54
MNLPVPLDLSPMEARLVAALPDEPGWRFEPKWDGFRCLAFKDGAEVQLQSKSGKPLTRYFPEMAAALAALPVERFVLDGELTISVDDKLSFDALQARLHPAASRVEKLSRETPAQFIVFDCLAGEDSKSLVALPLSARRIALKAIAGRFKGSEAIRLSPGTEDRGAAAAWLNQSGGALDGVVAKRLDEPYQPGERAMLKVKQLRSADCVVGGFRYEKDSKFVASLLLGLYDEQGLLNHVGFTSMISDAERPGLTRKLEALVGPPGFTGKAPGGPSRWTTDRTAEWSPLKPELVVEVRYDQVTGARFRHGTRLLRWRPDKAPAQCTLEQLQPEAAPARVIAAIG